MVHGLSIRHCDGAVLANLLESFGDHFPDLLITVGSDGGHTSNLARSLNHSCLVRKVLLHYFCCMVHPTLDVHRVHSSRHGLAAFSEDGACKDCGGGCAIAGNVIRLAGHRLHELRAHVNHGTGLQINGFGHCHPVFRHLRSTKGLLDHNVSALWSHRHSDCISQAIATFEHQRSSLTPMSNVLCCGKTSDASCQRASRHSSESGKHGCKARQWGF
mmetsp:Transcript_55096/g.103305  ORF Transcript_55096/g.103305 Transcript_55096/m.103305 type:complete len:216 (-) Transcript_55096:17-664(-)